MDNSYKNNLAIITLLVGLGIWQSYAILIYIALTYSILILLSEKLSDLLSGMYLSIIRLVGKINGLILFSLVFLVLIVPYAIILRLRRINLLTDRLQSISSSEKQEPTWFVDEDLIHPF